MPDSIPKAPVETVIHERDFVELLTAAGTPILSLTAALRAAHPAGWRKRHFHQLEHDANDLESFLDDFGARYNGTFIYLTELVASVRGLAGAACSLAHLRGRLASYGAAEWMSSSLMSATSERIERGIAFIDGSLSKMLADVEREMQSLGAAPESVDPGQRAWEPVQVQNKLPRNVGQDELTNESQRIAEVASKFIQASELLISIGAKRLTTDDARQRFLERCCSEEQARVYEATVHNLQSTYDTHVSNTVLEANDPRLKQLRGHASCALHLLETVTALMHFKERHESQSRSANEETTRRLAALVPPDALDEVVLHDLLIGATDVLRNGRPLAEDLLPSYTNVQELEVELLDGVALHARPAALIVKIVNHFGTPVEMELDGSACNAGSILEMLVAVGSSPDRRMFKFRGDERPLRHIGLLFERALGEGDEALPDELDYLRA